jgi:uncharacterized coiled-coil protein SlyX
MVAGYVYNAGQITAQVDNNTTRIVKLESVTAATDKTMQDLNIRGAQSATKLDFLVEQARQKQGQ